jgi:hypothetical protein
MLGVAQDRGGGTRAWSDLYDFDFRIFAGLANGGRHVNAAETLDVMKRQIALLMGVGRGTDGSFQTLDWMSFGRAIFAQGGYTPVPAFAHPDD